MQSQKVLSNPWTAAPSVPFPAQLKGYDNGWKQPPLAPEDLPLSTDRHKLNPKYGSAPNPQTSTNKGQ
jgi:hypothetical protein